MYQLDPIWSLAANLGYTERAPTFYELYANGAHVATGAFEVGDASLNKEKAISADLALRFDNGTHKGSVGVFYSHFRNYIGLIGTGNLREGGHDHDHDEDDHDHDHDDGFPEYQYQGVRARFYGIEAQDRWQLAENRYGSFALELSGDYTRAKTWTAASHCPASPRCA